MRKILYFLFGMLAIPGASADGLDYPSIWKCDVSKPNWYCDEDQSVAPPPVPAATPSPKKQELRPLTNKEIKTAEQMRAELKRREDLAVMNPTDANLKDYLELWQMTQEKGAVFADNWRRVVWQNPELDYSLKRPTNNMAVKTYDEQREVNEGEHLKKLAKEHGLIFFYRSDCPYCHAMAPTLKILEKKYGIEILAVSIDGAPLLPEYPTVIDGRSKATSWGIERVPALFIGSKKTGDHAPIGFGQMAMTEIVNRIFVLTGTKAGQNF